jgi:hypothetical protein
MVGPPPLRFTTPKRCGPAPVDRSTAYRPLAIALTTLRQPSGIALVAFANGALFPQCCPLLSPKAITCKALCLRAEAGVARISPI